MRPLLRASLILLAASAGCRPASPGGPAAALGAPAASVDTLTIRAASRVLAADAMQGRKTGTPGAERAAAWIADACARLGFAPGSRESYFQPVPLVEAIVDEARTRLRVIGPATDTTFVHGEEFLVDVGTAETLRGFAGEVAYVGRAPDILFRRSDLPPLEGKVALMRGELGASNEAADTLRARGAVGIVQVVDNAKRYRLFRSTRGPSRLYPDDAAVPTAYIPPIPLVIAGSRTTTTLYEGLTGVTHGSWNDAYLNGLAAGLPSPRLLPGWRIEVDVAVTRRPRTASNVACLLPGRAGAARGTLALLAHLDHLGIGEPDLRGDSIYNGFADNAAGVAMALAIGEWFARERAAGRGLDHDLLLLFPTGEEQGLLGADWFLAHPSVPLATLRGVVNLDANAPAGLVAAWRLAGDETGAPLRAALAIAAERGWSTAVAPASPGSDYYAFAARGIPSLFAVPAGGAYEGQEITASDSLRAALWSRYHRPDDEYADDFPFAGLGRYADFMRDVLRRLDEPAALARHRDQGGDGSATGPGGSR